MGATEVSTPLARAIAPERNLVRSDLFPEVLRFQLDQVCDDPMFGSAKHLEGEIPFLSITLGMRNQYAQFVADPQAVKRSAKEIVAKYRDVWPNKEDKEIGKIVTSLAIVAHLLVGPNHSMEPAVLDKLVQFIVMVVVYDDLFDKSIGAAFPGPDHYDYGQVWADLRAQTGWFPIHFPSGMVEWKVFSRTYQAFQDDMCRSIPNSDRHLPLIRDACLATMTAHVALGQLQQRETGNARYSEETMIELRRAISGGKSLLELIAMGNAVDLSDVIRGDEMFQIVVRRAADMISILNGILGLKRDVQLGQTDSPITSLVADDGATLQEAFDANMRRLHALWNDYVVAKRQLLSFFKNDANLQAYMRCMDTAIDGFVFMYTIMDRYGVHQGNCIIVDNPQFTD